MVGLLLAIAGLNVVNSYVGRDYMTALVDRRSAEFYRLALLYVGVFAASTVAAALQSYAQGRLGLLWRAWLADRLVGCYPKHRMYLRLRAAAGVTPKDAGTHAHLGHALESQGKPEEAIPESRESLRLNENDGWVRLHLGMCLRETNKVDGAIPHLREAVRLTPRDAQAHTELGYALHLKEDWDRAIAAYREGVRLDPMASYAHHNLGLVLQARGDLAGAIESFKLAQRLDPNDPDKFEALRTAQLMRDGRIAPPPREVRR
jgi:Flp pilus assembly protein TadD